MALEDFGFGAVFEFAVKGTPDLRVALAEIGRVRAALLEERAASIAAGRSTREIDTAMRALSVDSAELRSQLQLASAQMQRLSGVSRSAGFALALVGGALTAIGAAGLSVFKSAVEEAIKFEAVMTGLAIRARITAKEALADLARSFKRLGEELPGTATDMAVAGEIIAKTGTAIADIPNVVREAITLSVSEGTRAADAANLLSRTMRSFAQDLDQFGAEKAQKFNSALIAVSDSVAATASEVADAGRRAGNMGTAFGLTTPQILAYVAAVKDAGVTTQVSGTAVQALFKELTALTPEKIQALGVSVAELRALRPQELLELFARRVGEFSKRGDASGAVAFLEAFNLNSRRTTQAMLALGTAATQVVGVSKETGQEITRLNQIIQTGTAAFNEGTLSQQRMEERLKTLSARLDQLNSIWTNIKISFGEALTPLIGFVVDGLRLILTAFNALPEPVKKFIAISAVLFFGLVAGIGAVSVALGSLFIIASSVFFGLQLAGLSITNPLQAVRNWLQLIEIGFTNAAVRGQAFGALSTALGPLRATLAGIGTSLMAIVRAQPLLLPLAAGMNFIRLSARLLFGTLTSVFTVLSRVVGFALGGPIGLAVTTAVGLAAAGAVRAVRAAGEAAEKEGVSVMGALSSYFSTGRVSVEGRNLLVELGLEKLGIFVAQLGFIWDRFVAGFKVGIKDAGNFFRETLGFEVESFGEILDFLADSFLRPIKEALASVSESFGVIAPDDQAALLSVAQTMGKALGFAVGALGQVLGIFGIILGWIIEVGVRLALFFTGFGAGLRKMREEASAVVGGLMDKFAAFITMILEKISALSERLGSSALGKLFSAGASFLGIGVEGESEPATPPPAITPRVSPVSRTLLAFPPRVLSPQTAGSAAPVGDIRASITVKTNLDGVEIGRGLANVDLRNASRSHVAPPPQTSGGL